MESVSRDRLTRRSWRSAVRTPQRTDIRRRFEMLMLKASPVQSMEAHCMFEHFACFQNFPTVHSEGDNRLMRYRLMAVLIAPLPLAGTDIS